MSRRPESINVTRHRRADEGKSNESCLIDSLEIYSIARSGMVKVEHILI
jgi:hypothetical protein